MFSLVCYFLCGLHMLIRPTAAQGPGCTVSAGSFVIRIDQDHHPEEKIGSCDAGDSKDWAGRGTNHHCEYPHLRGAGRRVSDPEADEIRRHQLCLFKDVITLRSESERPTRSDPCLRKESAIFSSFISRIAQMGTRFNNCRWRLDVY